MRQPAALPLASGLLLLALRAGAQTPTGAPPSEDPPREPGAESPTPPPGEDQPHATGAETTAATTSGEPSEPSEPPEEAAKAPNSSEAPQGTPKADAAEEPIPLASDTLRGRLVLSLASGLVVPYGRMEKGVLWRDASNLGVGLSVEPAVGISRTVMLGVWGDAAWLGDGTDCTSCAAQTLAAGPFLRYHLVQGLRFDPWISAGAGVRSIRFDAAEDSTYVGIDWMRLTLGGDWYAIDALGIGPYAQATGGVSVARPKAPPTGELPPEEGSAVYWTLSLGLRVTLSPMSRR